MSRLLRLACVSFWLASVWLSGASEAGDPAQKVVEIDGQIELTKAAAPPLTEGSVEAAGKIAAVLGGLALATETRFGSISVPITFNPWEGQEFALAPDQHAGDSERLRKNMKHKGWECPAGYKAHHIVNKGDYRKDDPNYRALRDCLNRWGINIDAAGNGVCLPGKQETVAKDKSFSHKGREGNIHGPDVTQYMLKQCLAASSRKNMQNELDSWRKALTERERFW